MNTSKNLYVFILAYAFMLFGECNSILARHLADKMYELQSILPVLMMMQNYHKYFSLWNFYTEISQNTSNLTFFSKEKEKMEYQLFIQVYFVIYIYMAFINL